jgi:ribose transport system substrate-binding protein
MPHRHRHAPGARSCSPARRRESRTVAPALFAERALGSSLLSAAKNPTRFSDFKPFNPRIPRGPATGLPRRVATNFPAGSGYFIQFEKIVKKSIQARGMEFVPTTYGSDLAKNVDQLNQLLERGVGAIILQPQDVAGERATLLKAIKQGVCIAYEVSGPSTIQIAANQYKIGYTQGLQAVKWIKANLGGKAEVIVFNSTQISQSLTPRTTGRINALKTGGSGIKVVANQGITKLTVEEGNTLAQTLYQRYPNVSVWLGDDDTVLGVLSALEASGKDASDDIYLSGVNGQTDALAKVKAGTLFREDIAFPNGVYEYATGQLCCDWIEGRSVPQVMDIKLIPVSRANVDSFLRKDKNPAAVPKSQYKKYMNYLGNIDYRTRNKYVRGSIS